MKKRIKSLFVLMFAATLALNLSGCAPKSDDTGAFSEDIPQQEIDIPSDNTASANTVEVAGEEDTDKMVSISVENLGRNDPFMPSGERVSTSSKVPEGKLKYDLLEPLETPSADPVAQKVVSTKVSGIMYDKNNPSAILNIEGSDYFVRSGDVVNGYKILSITKNSVTVQMGSNVYKAGVGQLVADGQTDINYNTVANLSSKFGGSNKK